MTKTSDRLVRALADAEFACGEWRDANDGPYEALHKKAAKARDALERRIEYLESRRPR